MKKTLSLFISVTLFLSIVGTGQGSGRTNTGASLSLIQRNGAAVRFVPRQIRAANRKLRYTVKAKYPQAIGAARDSRLTKLNQELRTLVTKEVSDFKADFQEPAERIGPTGSYYESEYWVTLATNEL